MGIGVGRRCGAGRSTTKIFQLSHVAQHGAQPAKAHTRAAALMHTYLSRNCIANHLMPRCSLRKHRKHATLPCFRVLVENSACFGRTLIDSSSRQASSVDALDIYHVEPSQFHTRNTQR